MHERQEIDDASLEVDIEQAKSCTQPGCRRIASHCSALMDALVIFKSWFIQRQNELDHSSLTNQPPSPSTLHDKNMVPYRAHETASQDPEKSVLLADASLRAEHDWAMTRMRRMESQLNRLKNACLAMRIQLEVGLRHKSEAEQVKRDLEMAVKTVSHYQNIIEEGNRIRDDLRAELARARKDAAVARSQLIRPSPRMNQSPQVPIPYQEPRHSDDADMTATVLMSIGSPAVSSSTPTHVRNLLERQARWCDSLNAEVRDLQSTVHRLTEREQEQSNAFKTIQTFVQSTAEHLSSLATKRSRSHTTTPFGSVLSLQWLANLAELLHVALPENVTKIFSPSSNRASGSKRIVDCVAQGTSQAKRVRTCSTDSFESTLTTATTIQANRSPSPSHATPSGSELLNQVLSELNDVEAFVPSDLSQRPSPRAHSPAVLNHCLSTNDEPLKSTPISKLSLTPPPVDLDEAVDEAAHDLSENEHKTFLSDESTVSSPPPIHSPIRPLDALNDDSSSGEEATDSKSLLTQPSLADVHLDEAVKDAYQDMSALNEKAATGPTSPCSSPRFVQPNPQLPIPTSPSPTTPRSPNSSTSPAQVIVQPPDAVSSPHKPISPSRSRSMKIDDQEEVATRVLTCPSTYSRKLSTPSPAPQHISVSERLLSLLKSTYSEEVIDWFDRVTSTMPLESPSDHPPVEQSTTSVPPSQPKPSVNPSLVKSCVTFLQSKSNHNKASQSLRKSLRSGPPEELFPSVWKSLLDCLKTVQSRDVDNYTARFRVICSPLQSHLSTAMLCAEFFTHFNELTSPLGVLVATRCFLRLLGDRVEKERVLFTFAKLLNLLFVEYSSMSASAGCFLLPHLVDICHSYLGADTRLAQILNTPLADMTASPILIAIQSLLAWQEAFIDHCSVTSKQVPTLPDLESVLVQLHTRGWLPGARAQLPATALSQHNHHVRELISHLIDKCLAIRRLGTECLLAHTSDAEASLALNLLLRALAFIVGEHARLPDAKELDTHQKKRRNRRVKSQQLFGVMGWILNGKLLPWMIKQAKHCQSNTVLDNRLIFNRLAILTTDILLLISHLFTVSCDKPSVTLQGLHAMVFDVGGQFLQLLEQNRSLLFPRTSFSCGLRLLAFDPVRSMSIAVSHPGEDETPDGLPSTYLWEPFAFCSLHEQSIRLLSADGLEIPSRLWEEYTSLDKKRLSQFDA